MTFPFSPLFFFTSFSLEFSLGGIDGGSFSFYSNYHRDIHVEYVYFYQLILVCRGPIFEICNFVHVDATSVHETLIEIGGRRALSLYTAFFKLVRF